MLLATFNSFHFHLEALHTSHSVLAFESSLPSSMDFLMLKVEVFTLADGILQDWASSILDPWSVAGDWDFWSFLYFLYLFLVKDLLSCSFLSHQ
jgi:hypothetical protein